MRSAAERASSMTVWSDAAGQQQCQLEQPATPYATSLGTHLSASSGVRSLDGFLDGFSSGERLRCCICICEASGAAGC